jgi:hypothetical protein
MKSVPAYSNLILLTMIPLIIGDLYFAYKDFSCVHIPIENAHIGFTLSTWLKVSGWTSLAFIALPIINYFLSNITRLLIGYLVFAILYALFRFAWLVIGAVMFWGFLWPNRFCADALNTYMWVNLIYSFIICLLTCYLQQQTFTSSK